MALYAHGRVGLARKYHLSTRGFLFWDLGWAEIGVEERVFMCNIWHVSVD